MRIESIQVGKPQTISADFISSINKSPVTVPVQLKFENLEGDQQADLSVHGGPDKAVNVYPIEHYRYWNQRQPYLFRKRIKLPTPANGAFGENFTVSGLNESSVCIGDTFTVGSAIVQVSQPRQPCWKLARKFNQTNLPMWVQKNGKTGWYFRVLQEGHVTQFDTFTLTDRHYPDWTLQRTNSLRYSIHRSRDDIQSLLDCKSLSESWRKTFTAYLNDNSD